MRLRFLRVFVPSLVPFLLIGQTPKKKIKVAADVPEFRYTVNGKVEDLVKSPEAFKPFAAQVRTNVESVLRDYEIDDASTKRGLLGVLAMLDILDGHDAEARTRLDAIRALEEKPAQKDLSGLISRAILDARSQVPDRNSAAYRQAVYASVKRALEGMPFEIVENGVKSLKASSEIMTEGLIIGQIRASLDPVVAKTGGLSSDLAHGLPGMRLVLTERIPLRDTLIEVLGAYLSAHAVEKKDIWESRGVTLEAGKGYSPVTVAVWDSGVDLPVFKDKVYKDASGKPAVVAYDLETRKTSGYLFPLNSEQASRFKAAQKELKAFSDMQANIESPEATDLRKKLSAMKPDEVKPFLEEIELFASYSHGTHVAGIFTDGNPYARLAVARITFDWKLIPNPCPSRELSQRNVAASADYVDFFRKNSVRVVNMSWGGTVKDFEDGMEKCGIGKNNEDRKQQARALFEIEKTALDKALRSAPEVLFVAAAGNSNADSTFSEAIPASFVMPNLITVGAVDQAGDEASFTSYGPTVVVDANGFEVESYVPGGDRLKMSGTSMASPNVANLAAKILAVNPKLTPPQVIDVIRRTADKTSDGRRNLINPKKAVDQALSTH